MSLFLHRQWLAKPQAAKIQAMSPWHVHVCSYMLYDHDDRLFIREFSKVDFLRKMNVCTCYMYLTVLVPQH